LTPTKLSFAPHPVVTDTDRDKYCVKRIVEFYQKQPTDLSHYFFVCWEFHQSEKLDELKRLTLDELADRDGISQRYAQQVWLALNEKETAGPLAALQQMFESMSNAPDRKAALMGCQKMRDYVLELRPKLSPKFPNLMIEGNHKGSQPFVL